MSIPALIAALAALIVAGVSAAEKETNHAARLVGTWNCMTATVNGKPLSESAVRKLRLTMTEQRYKTERTDEVLFDSTYRLNATKTPMQINMVGTEGDLIGKEAKGILSVSNDTLTICYAMPGKPRPVSFQSVPGSEAHLVVWKRSTPRRAESSGRRIEENRSNAMRLSQKAL
jgi:uncharacterized protein (TIGR03067 family)